jgi:hypothetical protein
MVLAFTHAPLQLLPCRVVSSAACQTATWPSPLPLPFAHRAKTRDDVIRLLAEEIHWKTEQLRQIGPDWSDLSNDDRHFYYAIAEHIMLQEGLLRAAMTL